LKFFEAIKSLFPLSRAFWLFVDNNKRKLIKGLSKLPENVRHELELVYFDIFPDTTRFPEKWEEVFAVLFSSGETVKRRNILDSLWKINTGGQSAKFLEMILQSIDTNIKIIENNPICDPRVTLAVHIAICGNRTMRCGNYRARCDYRFGNNGFIPSMLRNDNIEFYTLPDGEDYWAYCFFVCKNALRNGNQEIVYVEKLKIDAIWKNYIEYLILKIKPVHSAAIVFIDWQGVNND
jgi:hypothetical protein